MFERDVDHLRVARERYEVVRDDRPEAPEDRWRGTIETYDCGWILALDDAIFELEDRLLRVPLAHELDKLGHVAGDD